MTISVEEIQKAIAVLPPEELARLRRWFEEFDAQRWDEQFQEDVRAGKLDPLAEQALQDYASGRFKEL